MKNKCIEGFWYIKDKKTKRMMSSCIKTIKNMHCHWLHVSDKRFRDWLSCEYESLH